MSNWPSSTRAILASGQPRRPRTRASAWRWSSCQEPAKASFFYRVDGLWNGSSPGLPGSVASPGTMKDCRKPWKDCTSSLSPASCSPEAAVSSHSSLQALAVQPVPAHRVLGVCHFPTFRSAMVATKHLVELGPVAVELVDRNIIELGRESPQFRATLGRFVRGEPGSLLLVEFAGDDREDLVRDLGRLDQAMGDLGFAGAVVQVTDPAQQRSIWEVREAGLNIMMSMKGDGKPVSFIEDCAVPLEHLAEYTDRLTRVFEKNGTCATWYAHASVGTLRVRPILAMRRDGAEKMRAIAEEACAMVKEYKGAYSGE